MTPRHPRPCASAPRGRAAVLLAALLLFLLGAPPLEAAPGADTLYRQGDYQQAQKLYEELDLKHPDRLAYRFNRGCAAYQGQDYAAAQAAFTSVLRRAQEDGLRFKAAFNLGNSAFQTGGFQEAAQAYKLALTLQPESAKARYNLELALTKLAEQSQKQPESGQEGPPESADQGAPDQGQSDQTQPGQQQGKDQEGPETAEGQADAKQLSGPEQPGQAAEGEQPPEGTGAEHGQTPEAPPAAPPEQPPPDLSGELRPAVSAPAAPDGQEPPPAPAIGRQKAEALLDNVQEDRTRYLRLPVPEDKRGGVKSGKYW